MSEPERETLKFKKRTSKRRLSKRTVDALKPPAPKANGKPSQEWHYDETTARLAICVWSTGAKTWYWVGRLKNGGMIRFKLANYPETTPSQAKELAADVSRDVVKGLDPRDEKNRQREEWTLAQLFAEYLERHAKPHKKTWAEDESQFNRYCGKIKNRKVSAIHHADVMNLHAKVGKENGRYAANRLLALLSKVFNEAAKWGLKVHNPAENVTRFKEESRERFLSAEELKRFFEALEMETALWRDFFAILLLTGARKSNVMAMRFAEIDFERQIWRIPKTKNSDPLSVPLVAQAVQILQARRESVKGDWVFPARRGKTPHITEPKTAWARIIKRANLEGVRQHDLRRTLGSWQAASGSSLPIIGKSLGHKSQQATAIYSRLDIDPVRESVERAVNAMFNTTSPKDG